MSCISARKQNSIQILSIILRRRRKIKKKKNKRDKKGRSTKCRQAVTPCPRHRSLFGRNLFEGTVSAGTSLISIRGYTGRLKRIKDPLGHPFFITFDDGNM